MNIKADQYFQVNQTAWDALVPLHLGPGEVYDIEAFKRGASTLTYIERDELGDVSGKSILHAQCHFGLDSMSLARMGAKVTGVDFSDKAIEAARALNDECGLDCRFVCCNIYDLPEHVNDQFDIAFASYGVLCWLPDLNRWARILADRLRDGGMLYVADGHPYSFGIDHDAGQPFPVVRRSYFADSEPMFCAVEDDDTDYHATDKQTDNPTYEWNHTVADVINAVAGAGLTIKLFHEHPVASFRVYKEMVKGEDGMFHHGPGKPTYPMVFSLMAVKG